MTRSQHQKKIDKVPAQSAKYFGKNFLFAGVGAAAKYDYSILGAKTGENGSWRGCIDNGIFRIALNATHMPDPRSGSTPSAVHRSIS